MLYRSLTALPDGDPGELGFIPNRLEELRLRLDSYVSEGHYAGITALIARDGRVAYFSAHGYRDLEDALPMDRETIVRIYSMTKVVVSVAALMLFEEGRFRLGDPLSLYLPEFAASMVVAESGLSSVGLIPPSDKAKAKGFPSIYVCGRRHSGAFVVAPDRRSGCLRGSGLGRARPLAQFVS